MVKNYWALFYLTLIGMIIFVSLFILGFVFSKKIFLDKKYGAILLIICSCISFALSTLCASKFTLCCKDYNYVSNNTYIEEKAKVVNFTVSCFDYDGSGRQENNKPKFYLIEKNEDGINAHVSFKGENMSLGEKQLISFARILLRNPSILILDEATANIDTETEIMIQNALKVTAVGRTTFVVAHRLSTIRNADNIFVLDDGEIVEQGTHEELYNKNGKYRKMYEAQYNQNK